MTETNRRRIIEWSDPLATAEYGRTLSGLDYLTAMANKQIPQAPIGVLLGIDNAEFSEGKAIMSLEPREFHYNPLGVVHGGALSTLLDSVLGTAVHTILPIGRAHTTLTLEVKFIKSVTIKTGRVTAEASVMTWGKQVMTASGHIRDDANVIYATGTTTCLIFDIPANR